MKKSLSILFLLVLLTGMLFGLNTSVHVSDYKTIDKPVEVSNETTFHQLMDVLTHPRCMNCHPTDNLPKQGMERQPHHFDMARGADDHGFEATQCHTCHQKENNPYSGVPGAPHWGLAPASMGWQGLTRIEIAERLLNTETNGGKNHEALVEHLTKDALVLWAWNPGVDANGVEREKPPLSKEEYIAVVEKWFADGAVIPTK